MRQQPNTPYINLAFHLGLLYQIMVLMRQQPNTPYINLAFHLGLLYLDRHSDR